MTNKKVLIIANNCLSEHNSNGRTLLNLLREFPRENISQIYTSGEIADDSFCGASLRVTNGEVVRSYLRAPVFSMPLAEQNDKQTVASSKKNAMTMLFRDIVWDRSFRTQKAIIEWAKEQKPDCVVLQVGDASLQIQIAINVVKALNIPLVSFNTEDYYFKKYDYMKRTPHSSFAYKIFHRRFRRAFKSMMRFTPACVYNCEGLKDLYDREFKSDSTVLYCGTDVERVSVVKDDGLILYAGNLGLGRHKELIEIGKVLQSIDRSLCLDVFGQAQEDVKAELIKAQGIRYHGFVSYQQVRENIRNSRLLVHVESFDDYNAMDTQYAFSTKIADYLASGIPVFLYGPVTGEGIRYIKKHYAAFVADKRESLREELNRALFDGKSRQYVSTRAVKLASENHDISKNGLFFRGLIEKKCKDNAE